jgi:hypothetical protein
MRTNNSAHQVIELTSANETLFVSEWKYTLHELQVVTVADPAAAHVFHPFNPIGKETLVDVKLNFNCTARLVDRATAIENFNKK